jgi:repressor LexA
MNLIKEILEEKGVKQTWLADKLGKSYNMINSYVQNRRQPSIDDLFRIAEILNVDPKELLDNKKKKEAKIIQLENSHAETTKIPILGRVACGAPIFAEENIEAYISVSNELLNSSNKYFILRASGDSMDESGINDGDLVLIKQQQTANNGDRVVALIDEEATIKELQKKDNMIVLKPQSSNNTHQPIILTTNFRIQGVVETVIPI